MKDLGTLAVFALLLPHFCVADIDDPEVVAAEALFSGVTKKTTSSHRTMRTEEAPQSLLEVESKDAAKSQQELVASTRKVVRSELRDLKKYLTDLFPYVGEGQESSLVQLADFTDPTTTIADLQAINRDIKRQPKRPEHPKGMFELRPFEDDEAKQLDELDNMVNPAKKGLPPIPDRRKESLAEQKVAIAKAHKAALERPPDEDDLTKAMDGNADSMERLTRALHKQTSLNQGIQQAKQKRLDDADQSLQEQIDWSKERELDKDRQWPPAPSQWEQDDLWKSLPGDSASSDSKVDLDSLLKESQPSADGPLKTFRQSDIDSLLGK